MNIEPRATASDEKERPELTLVRMDRSSPADPRAAAPVRRKRRSCPGDGRREWLRLAERAFPS
jgi:hypothetical protein